MTRQVVTRSIGGVVGLVLVAGAALACSSSSPASAPDSTTNSTSDSINPIDAIPSSDGDSCTDPVGDISASIRADAPPGVLTEPAGIDIVSAAATVAGDDLHVTFVTNGPVASAPQPTFVVAQGEPLQPVSFEVRSVQAADGRWEVGLVRWPTGDEVRTVLPITPTVTGSTFDLLVPLAELGPIANYLGFGVSADVGQPDGVVFDDCSSLVSSS